MHRCRRQELRIEGLHKLAILDTEPEREYDEMTEMASMITACPISLISLASAARIS